MAESMKGLKRTCRCAELSEQNIGDTVTVMGWVQKQRNKGGIIFVDLRDRSGILQLIFEESEIGSEGFAKAEKLRSEFVVAVTGEVTARSGAVNDKLATGKIEVRAKAIRVLSESETPPFPIEADSKTKEDIRLKYRYLDLRRPDLQRNLIMRSRVATLIRQFLADEGFLEIETPMLTKSTPEGARDYLVPSRVHPGNFYALPQSPQLFKQLLMCSGYDRYFQIARCFRDEDLRADRQPEFTQVDMELSFVDEDDVMDVNERLLQKIFKEVLDVDVELPIQRMTWQEAMDRFGSDKPDLRFGMELHDVSDVVKGCGFGVFTGALENGGSVRGINAKGQGAMPRKKIDALVKFAKDFGAKGLAYLCINEDGTYKSSFAKFMTEEELDALVKAMDGEAGDLLLFAADKNKIVWDVLGNLRLEIARNLDLLDKNVYKFLWVTEFPEFEYSEELCSNASSVHDANGRRYSIVKDKSGESTRQSIRYRAERYRAWWWFHPYSSGRCTGNDV
jgi:aspartyl-tRNA synthetase